MLHWNSCHVTGQYLSRKLSTYCQNKMTNLVNVDQISIMWRVVLDRHLIDADTRVFSASAKQFDTFIQDVYAFLYKTFKVITFALVLECEPVYKLCVIYTTADIVFFETETAWIPLCRWHFQIHFVHDDVIKWKHFPRYWPCVREFTGHRWLPLTKASDAELWCILWSAPEQTVE